MTKDTKNFFLQPKLEERLEDVKKQHNLSEKATQD